ncbi:MAG: hydantoinase/oxoprolinase family protein [Actinobacteria bacterium]|nr:hydantoinase/oxoprolinase family protein [Actinomycetota bacterium]
MKRFRVAMDIGGTFTDFVLYDEVTGEYRTGKVSTTPKDLSIGVLEGLVNLTEDFSAINFCVHGTTSGLNAFLERKGARVALITTEGFRDVYEIARGNRPEMYNVQYRKPEPLVKRRDVFEIPERVLFDDTVAVPVDPGAVREVASRIRAGGYESVAVGLLHAHMNPVNEKLVRDVLREELPGVSISLSHEVAREWREYERTSTTVLNAYVAPIVEKYLARLEGEVKSGGMEEPLYIMRSNGGVMTAEVAKAHPIQTLLSGPVGGAVGGASLAREMGIGNLIGVDMGGTSFDVTMVINGRADVTNETNLEGFPVLTPMVNIHTIGAGGGSIAWIEGGGLRVGPQSAGAQPGPACYGRGGTRPTVTDANVVLGRVDPEHFLGGRMQLLKEKAREAVASIAGQLGLTVEQAAEGICDVVNAKMADAIRTITVRKGIDPRDFTLVAFGGAGPMHAVFIAQLLDMKSILVPRFPGAFSAWGMLQSDIRHDEVRTFVQPAAQADTSAMQSLYGTLEREVGEVLKRQKITADQMTFVRTVDMRYVGQEYTVNVPMPGGPVDGKSLAALTGAFHERHQQIYGHSNPKGAVEIVNLRVVGVGELSSRIKVPPVETNKDVPKPRTVAPIIFGGRELPTPIFVRDHLRPGQRFEGAAIIEEFTATTVVPPGYWVQVDRFGSMLISAAGEE